MGINEDDFVMELLLKDGWKKKMRRRIEGETQLDFVTYLSPNGEEVDDMEQPNNNTGSPTLQLEANSTKPINKLVNREAYNISKDLLRLIICRLPDYALVRFASAGEAWHELIYDPSFIEMHRQLGVCCSSTLFIEGFSDDKGSKYYRVQQDGHVHSLKHTGWNMMTVRGVSKSNILLASRVRSENTALIIFDMQTLVQQQLPHARGGYYDLVLGYDDIANDLRIFHLFRQNEGDWKYAVLSVNKEEWGRTNSIPFVQDFHLPALVKGGNPYYLSTSMNDEPLLVSFDLRSDAYKSYECPESIDPTWSHLVQINGNLCLCWIQKYTSVIVWAFKDGNWINYHNIDLHDEVSLFRSMAIYIAPLDLNDEMGVVMRNEVKLYSLETRGPRIFLRVPWATSITPWELEVCLLQSPNPSPLLTTREEKEEEEEMELEEYEETFRLDL